MALNTGDKNAKITVLMVTKTNEMIVDRLEVFLKDGLLPIRDIKKKWNAKGLIWVDLEDEIQEDKNGYSTISFAFFDKIKVWKKD